MENNNEFVDYIKRNPEAIKDNFRRKTTVRCLEDYAEELARRTRKTLCNSWANA